MRPCQSRLSQNCPTPIALKAPPSDPGLGVEVMYAPPPPQPNPISGRTQVVTGVDSKSIVIFTAASNPAVHEVSQPNPTPDPLNNVNRHDGGLPSTGTHFGATVCTMTATAADLVMPAARGDYPPPLPSPSPVVACGGSTSCDGDPLRNALPMRRSTVR